MVHQLLQGNLCGHQSFSMVLDLLVLNASYVGEAVGVYVMETHPIIQGSVLNAGVFGKYIYYLRPVCSGGNEAVVIPGALYPAQQEFSSQLWIFLTPISVHKDNGNLDVRVLNHVRELYPTDRQPSSDAGSDEWFGHQGSVYGLPV